jgi:hypothetical protein
VVPGRPVLLLVLLAGCSKPSNEAPVPPTGSAPNPGPSAAAAPAKDASCEAAAERLGELSIAEAQQAGLPAWTPEKLRRKKDDFLRYCREGLATGGLKQADLECVLAASVLTDAQRCLPKRTP